MGAVKYKGFVPWDDDIDVAIPRKDYNKLISIMPEHLAEDCIFVSYQRTVDAHCYFPRIVLEKKACEKMGLPQNNERGLVLIDILPLDGLPDSKIARKIHILKAYAYRVLASLWTLDVKDTVSMHGKKDSILKMLHFLGIHRLYKQDDIYRRLDKMYARSQLGVTDYCGVLAGSKLRKEVMPYSWWDKGTHGSFQELDVLIPKEYDLYLKQLFGSNYANYEPSISDRTKSHLRKRGVRQ